MHVIQIIVQQNLNVKATEDLVERTISRMYGIEKEEEEQSRTRPSKISGFVRDTRLFVNSLRTVVQQMADAGLNPKLESRDKEEGMEIKIWIPHPAVVPSLVLETNHGRCIPRTGIPSFHRPLSTRMI